MRSLADLGPLVQRLNAIEAIASNLVGEAGISDEGRQELAEIMQLLEEAHVAAAVLLPGYAVAREIENQSAIERGRQLRMSEVPH